MLICVDLERRIAALVRRVPTRRHRSEHPSAFDDDHALTRTREDIAGVRGRC